MTSLEREWVHNVKLGPCSCCDEEGVCDAHEIEQGAYFTSVALCRECHTGSIGWHGTKAIFKIKKLDELSCLNKTVEQTFKRINK